MVVVLLCMDSCRELVELNLTKQATLSAAGLSSLAALHHLQRLVLYSCVAVNDEVLQRLSCTLKSLHHLSLARCVRVTDLGLCAIINANPGLQELIVSYCRNITDLSLSAMQRLVAQYIVHFSVKFSHHQMRVCYCTLFSYSVCSYLLPPLA